MDFYKPLDLECTPEVKIKMTKVEFRALVKYL